MRRKLFINISIRIEVFHKEWLKGSIPGQAELKIRKNGCRCEDADRVQKEKQGFHFLENDLANGVKIR